MLVSTIIGFLTIAGASVAFYGLPAIASRPVSDLKASWIGPIVEREYQYHMVPSFD